MKHGPPSAYLSIPFLRYVRDARPTEEQLLAWLGTNSDRYHVLRQARLIAISDGRVHLSALHLSADGRIFHYENQQFLIDEGSMRTLVRGR